MQRTKNTRELWRTLCFSVSQVTTTNREAKLTIEHLNTSIGVVGIKLSPRLDVGVSDTCRTVESTKAIQVGEQRSIVVIQRINVVIACGEWLPMVQPICRLPSASAALEQHQFGRCNYLHHP